MENFIGGKRYKYLGKVAYCSICKSEIFVGKILDYNLKILYNQIIVK